MELTRFDMERQVLLKRIAAALERIANTLEAQQRIIIEQSMMAETGGKNGERHEP